MPLEIDCKVASSIVDIHLFLSFTISSQKSAFVALVRSGVNVDTVFDGWMNWIYCDLPFNYVVRLEHSNCVVIKLSCLIIIMEICKVPMLRLKALNKHNKHDEH